MCTRCGCGDEREHQPAEVHARKTIRLERALLEENGALASATRRALDGLMVRMFDVIGGPGSGKTALLEATIPRLLPRSPIAVLEGDQATSLDARRIENTGCAVVQINTGPGCHLDAAMVRDALSSIAPRPMSIVFVENVGNLVCPALFDIGEHAKVVVMSVTEGEDKPLKYAHAFRAAEIAVLTKLDLLPHLAFDIDRCRASMLRVNPSLRILPVSALTGVGIDAWCSVATASIRS